MSVQGLANITGGPASAEVGENISVTSAHTARVTNSSGAAITCTVTYRISHDRGSHKFEKVEPHSIPDGGSLNETANGLLNFAPEVTGPHRMKATTIVDCGTFGNDEGVSTNWTIQVSAG